ncbi:hypothetical protein [Nonomuraea sp. NPDC003754]
MSKYDGYHGIHAARGYPVFTPVDWYPVTPRADRIRVRASTCQCSEIVYEYCAAGGLYFIRRHDRTGPKASITETAWLNQRPMGALWLRILDGEAR